MTWFPCSSKRGHLLAPGELGSSPFQRRMGLGSAPGMEAAAQPAEQMSGECSLSRKASEEEHSKPAGRCGESAAAAKTDLALEQLQGLV